MRRGKVFMRFSSRISSYILSIDVAFFSELLSTSTRFHSLYFPFSAPFPFLSAQIFNIVFLSTFLSSDSLLHTPTFKKDFHLFVPTSFVFRSRKGYLILLLMKKRKRQEKCFSTLNDWVALSKTSLAIFSCKVATFFLSWLISPNTN